MVFEMIALPESFCICLSLGESTRQYAEVLSENGIPCRLEGVLSGNRGYVELREYEQWQYGKKGEAIDMDYRTMVNPT